MSKRRVTKQQQLRIDNKAALTQQEKTPHTDEGLVITRFGRFAKIQTSDGNLRQCAIRPHIHSLVAGDRVVFQSDHQDNSVIISCYPRSTVLNRYDSRLEPKPMAANFTQIIIVGAIKPVMSFLLMDSYLVMTELLGVKPLIIVNKIDLADNDAFALDMINTYEKRLNYPVIFYSTRTQEGLEPLQKNLQQEVSIFVGQSGVGKSTIISELLPSETIATAPLSEQSGFGCHTTRNSSYYHLPTGGALIDAPGVREFNLKQLKGADILRGFKEFYALARECKFRNCTHINTPDCAVIKAVQDKRASSRRFEHMLKLMSQVP